MANSRLTRRTALLGLLAVAACASSGSKDADGRTPEQQAFCQDYPNDYHCRPRYPTGRTQPTTSDQVDREITRQGQVATRRTIGTVMNSAMRKLSEMLGR
jgi:hypothetical protein